MTKQDARYLAQTVARLERNRVESRDPVEDALTLHRIAGSLHRYDERECNEDLSCRRCHGDGLVPHPDDADFVRNAESLIGVEFRTVDCPECAGTGSTIGKRVRNLEAKAGAIALAYGFRAYFQGDCRGCPLYLIPESIVPASRGAELADYRYECDQDGPPSLSTLQSRWIASNYTRGHAVPWLG